MTTYADKFYHEGRKKQVENKESEAKLKQAKEKLNSPIIKERECFCGNNKFKIYLDENKLMLLVCDKCFCHRVVLYGTYENKEAGHVVDIPFKEKE